MTFPTSAAGGLMIHPALTAPGSASGYSPGGPGTGTYRFPGPPASLPRSLSTSSSSASTISEVAMAHSRRQNGIVPVDYDAVVIGAGFSGLYMLHKLRQAGFTAKVFEQGDGVGGTWFWNRYPGARCDVQSIEYSYSFDDSIQQEWVWSEPMPPQSEVEAYLNFVCDRLDL